LYGYCNTFNDHAASRRVTPAKHPFYVEGKGFVNAGCWRLATASLREQGRALKLERMGRKAQCAMVCNFELWEISYVLWQT
jgi:hypothetical protein